MATYNKEYYWNPPRRKKQRYALVERVVDFSKAPVTAGIPGQRNSSDVTTAWAAGDVLKAIQIRAGQTVLGVTVEVLVTGDVALSTLRVGYGDDVDYWGAYEFAPATSAGVKIPGPTGGTDAASVQNFGKPLYFSAADTIDIVINKALTAGKVRLIVHLLEDDR